MQILVIMHIIGKINLPNCSISESFQFFIIKFSPVVLRNLRFKKSVIYGYFSVFVNGFYGSHRSRTCNSYIVDQLSSKLRVLFAFFFQFWLVSQFELVYFLFQLLFYFSFGNFQFLRFCFV